MKTKFGILLVLLCVLKGINALSQGSQDENDANFEGYNNFDFIAGKKILFYDDFTQGLSKWNVIDHAPSDEIEPPGTQPYTGDETSWFKLPQKGLFYPKQFELLPDEFTIEFDMQANTETMSEMEGGLCLSFVANLSNRDEYDPHFDENPQIQLDIHPSKELLYCLALKENNNYEDRVLMRKQIQNGWNIGKTHRISISRKKSHVRVYINEKKFIDLPQGLPQKGRYSLVLFTNLWGDGLYISQFKIAEGLSEPAALNNEGKFVTNAIYFNTNSTQIRPESWAALQQAAHVIESATGSITIVGHTDSDGHDEVNLTLSKNRAEAVKQSLIRHFKIDANRLLTDGKGESMPVAENTSAEGKAMNRRVEFILTK